MKKKLVKAVAQLTSSVFIKQMHLLTAIPGITHIYETYPCLA